MDANAFLEAATVLNCHLMTVGSNPTSSTLVGNYLYVNNFGSNDVTVIDTSIDYAASAVIATIPVGAQPNSSVLA